MQSMVVTRRREEFMTKLQNSNSKIHILRNVASKKVRKVEKGEEIYPSIHKDNLRYAQSNATKVIQESEQGRRAAFKEDHLAKRSIIVKPFYLQEENLLALSMVHKEIKFYKLSVSSKTNKFHY